MLNTLAKVWSKRGYKEEPEEVLYSNKPGNRAFEPILLAMVWYELRTTRRQKK